jgi:hypothetical protein
LAPPIIRAADAPAEADAAPKGWLGKLTGAA